LVERNSNCYWETRKPEPIPKNPIKKPLVREEIFPRFLHAPKMLHSSTKKDYSQRITTTGNSVSIH
jgi:hypothetical protein